MSYSKENGQQQFRIHYTLQGVEDSFDVEADSVEQVREIAGLELHRRGALLADCWSEDLNR